MTRFFIASALGAFTVLLAQNLPAHAAQNPPPTADQATFDRLAAEPLRYAGLSSPGNARILLGLHPTAQGGLEGEMMQLDATMRPQFAGPAKGHFTGTALHQTARCTVSITLPERDLLLDGPCSDSQMSGALSVHQRPSQLWSQVSQFISPDPSLSQYWLTRQAWQQATTPSAARP